ncbi:MFS transporter [Bordetella genomosp. 13]|nr:MFS transporter [Bordetella genomosp. 13]
MSGRLNLVAAAFALTALSYGLARFAYGLLLPDIRAELSLSATAAGWVAGSAFAAYCFGIVFAIMGAARLGERGLTVAAGLAATCSLALVSMAASGLGLGLAIALGGLSTGLTSPPLATAVSRWLDGTARPKANGAINAGTAAGIMFSGISVMAFAGQWRGLYGGFAAIGAAVTAWLWVAMPKGSGHRMGERLSARGMARAGAAGLCASAFLMGAASTAIWTFGANLMREELGMQDGAIALGWIVLGAAGLAGMGTGLLSARYGIGTVHRAAVFAMALAIAGLAAAPLAPMLAYAVMGLFGVAYIVSSGAFLLWGIRIYSDRPDMGLGLPFLMIALGQTAGAPLFGAIWDMAGSAAALLVLAALMAGAACWTESAGPALADSGATPPRDGIGPDRPVATATRQPAGEPRRR